MALADPGVVVVRETGKGFQPTCRCSLTSLQVASKKTIWDFDWLSWTLTRYNRCFNAQRRHKLQTFEGSMNVKDHTAGLSVPAAATAVLLRNLPLAGLYVALDFGMSFLLELSEPDGCNMVVVTILTTFIFSFILPLFSLILFSTVLLDVSGLRTLRVATAFRFIWRDIILVSVVGFGLISLLLLAVGISEMFGSGSDETSGFYDSPWFLYGFIVLGSVYFFIIYGFLGTWLVAVVVGGNRKLSAAFSRGKLFFKNTLGQLMVFVGPVILLMSIGYVLADGPLMETDGNLHWPAVTSTFVGIICHIFATAEVVVILARAYLEAGD